VCDKADGNVPQHAIGRAPLTHAVGYSTGETGLIGRREFLEHAAARRQACRRCGDKPIHQLSLQSGALQAESIQLNTDVKLHEIGQAGLCDARVGVGGIVRGVEGRFELGEGCFHGGRTVQCHEAVEPMTGLTVEGSAVVEKDGAEAHVGEQSVSHAISQASGWRV
jgi:hypothetical protein